LDAVVTASQAAQQQQQQQQQTTTTAGAAASGVPMQSGDAAGGAAREEKLYLYTFEQHVQYQGINSSKARQHIQQQQQGYAEGDQVKPQDTRQQQGMLAPVENSKGGSGAHCRGSRQSAEPTLQGIAASPGEMLLLSADGVQVGCLDMCSAELQTAARHSTSTCSETRYKHSRHGQTPNLMQTAGQHGVGCTLLLGAVSLVTPFAVWAPFPQVNIGRVDVVGVSGSSITVASRKDLQLDRYEAAAAPADASGSSACSGSSVLWRLDHDEAASIGMHQRAAVLRLTADSTGSHVQRLRELIVQLAVPRQRGDSQSSQQQAQQLHHVTSARARSSSPQPVAQSLGKHGAGAAGRAGSAPPAVDLVPAAPPAPAAAGAEGAQQGSLASCTGTIGAAARLAAASGESYLSSHGSHLNSNQVAVLRRVIEMQDYCLVLGMPGEQQWANLSLHCLLLRQQVADNSRAGASLPCLSWQY
jgi:hypothetical protein